MNCCVTDMRSKEVINSCDGVRLGNVYDVEVDTCSGRLVAITVTAKPGCLSFLNFFFRSEDIRICWEDIEVIGNDTILVKYNCPHPPKRGKRNPFDGLFR